MSDAYMDDNAALDVHEIYDAIAKEIQWHYCHPVSYLNENERLFFCRGMEQISNLVIQIAKQASFITKDGRFQDHILNLETQLTQAINVDTQKTCEIRALREWAMSTQGRLTRVELAWYAAVNLYPDLDELLPEEDYPKMFPPPPPGYSRPDQGSDNTK